jgi:hypothetical protein
MLINNNTHLPCVLFSGVQMVVATKQKIKIAGADWIAEQKFWLFGTARYVDGSCVHRRTLVKDAQHFFNTVDRVMLNRKDYDEGRRLQRLVFHEQGMFGTNAHFHFFIKGTHLRQYKHILQLCEGNWSRHIKAASDCKVLDNIELIHERKFYCWKEFCSLDNETLITECCHLEKPHYT